MFFILSKVLLILIQPTTWLLFGLLAIFFLKVGKWKTRIRKFTIGLFVFLTFPIFLLELLRQWEVPAVKASEIGNYDVGIVLGGMFTYNNDVKELSTLRSADRIWQALNLYHRKKIKKILISGDDGDLFDQGLNEAMQLKKVLLQWGIPREDILIENISKNTFENAVETKKLLRKHPELKRKLLITSGMHMRRAKAIFEKHNLKVTCFSTNMHTGPNRNYTLETLLIPTFYNMNTWDKFTKEVVGYVVYDATGRI